MLPNNNVAGDKFGSDPYLVSWELALHPTVIGLFRSELRKYISTCLQLTILFLILILIYICVGAVAFVNS